MLGIMEYARRQLEHCAKFTRIKVYMPGPLKTYFPLTHSKN